MSEDLAWINPIGGAGDALMLSGVLRRVMDDRPGEQYYLVRRTQYGSIVGRHPILRGIGSPPEGAQVITTDYWSKEPLGADGQRPFQILARTFGIKTPVPETLYLPGPIPAHDLLQDLLPFDRMPIVLIAPSSASPRKMLPAGFWRGLTERLRQRGMFVVQVGSGRDLHITGAYSVLGITTPHELLALVRRCALVITVDNFVLHISHLASRPTVALWGPTDFRVYGYGGQSHIQADVTQCPERNACLGPGLGHNYQRPCPFGDRHCMTEIRLQDVYETATTLIREGGES